MDVYARPYNVAEKEDRSPLTEADTRSHERIESILPIATPEIPVLSEEGVHLPYEERASWKTFWMVDPLDGTKEFIKHNDEFTVNIALMTRTEGGAVAPVLGVVYAPALETIFAGIVGHGAWRMKHVPAEEPPSVEELRQHGTPLPDAAARTGRPYTIVASRSHMSPETATFIEERRRDYPDMELISAGSSLKICRVAEGTADEYPRFAPTMEWDTAAGDAVARAAGCEVLRWNDGTRAPDGSLQYNKQDLHNPWFLVRRAAG